jgi:hypothetical protein
MQGPHEYQTREVLQTSGGMFLLSTLDLWSVSVKFQRLLESNERFESIVVPCDDNGHVGDISKYVHRVRASEFLVARDLALEWLRRADVANPLGIPEPKG